MKRCCPISFPLQVVDSSDMLYQDQDHNDNRMETNMLKKILYTTVAVIIGMAYFVVALSSIIKVERTGHDD